jgi:hypothetical protein
MNIAEILKYCPKDTKLYSTVFGEVEFSKINPDDMIVISVKDGSPRVFHRNGSYSEYGECVLFPSKDQRDWKKFRLPVKRGDIMMSDNKAFIISDEYADAFNNAFHKYICGIDTTGTFKVSQSDIYWTSKFYIPASEEAKKKLFDKMTEAGYRWNADTLELEKIEPKFKEGDVIIDNQGNLCLVSKIRDDSSVTIAATLYANKALNVFISNNVNRCIQLVTIASTTDRNKLYSAITRKGYKYDKEQHKLVKQKFKPFDKVLVRDDDTDSWEADIYLGYDEGKPFPYICTRAAYSICISYEGNEYLLDTIDSPTCVNRKE